MDIKQATSSLREVMARRKSGSKDAADQEVEGIIAAKERVRNRYAPIFSQENVSRLSEEDFRSFLLFRNNEHWDGLHRQAGMLTADMPRLRDALALLVDESKPLEVRLNKLRPKSGEPMVKGLGRSVITAVLQVVYPDKYGVLNNTTEAAMQQLQLWPKVPGSVPFAEKYTGVNEILLKLAAELDIDLWTLDALWWRLVVDQAPKGTGKESAAEEAGTLADPMAQGFGMESHLHEFLVDNWSKLDLGRDWNLLEEDGELKGSEYNTREVGAIDLLAKSTVGNNWLVVELKKGQTSDETVGQILRYMSWVRLNMAKDGGTVEGLVICGSIDKKMQYALDGLPNIRCMTYEVSFNLRSASKLQISSENTIRV